MAINSPLNSFQRNSQGTFDKIVPQEEPVYLQPGQIQPPSSQRNYDHLVRRDFNSNFSIAASLPSLNDESARNSTDNFIGNFQSDPYQSQQSHNDMYSGVPPPRWARPDNHQQQYQQPQMVQQNPQVNAVRHHNEVTLGYIKQKHPQFNNQFFIIDEKGLAGSILCCIASYFYKERKSFTYYDLLLIAEGKLLPSFEESVEVCERDFFYKSFELMDMNNIFTNTNRNPKHLQFVKDAEAEFVEKIYRLYGKEFFKNLEQRNKGNMQKNILQVGVVHGRSSVGDSRNNTAREDAFSGAINCKTVYFNHCNFDLVVVERSGLKQVVKSRTMDRKPVFIIKKIYSIGRDAFSNLTDYFTYTPEEMLTDTIKIFKTHFNENIRNLPHAQTMQIAIDVSIDVNQIKINNGNVYISSEDILVSDKPFMKAPPHPFNARNFNVESFSSFSDDSRDVGINFEIVDNEGRCGDRFIMIANKLHKLSAKKDNIRKSGLYITTMERDPINEGKRKPVQVFHELENMKDEFNIFKTPEEAMSGGDIQNLRKENLMEMEHNHKIELQIAKNIALDKEKEISDLKHQIQQSQMKNDIENQKQQEKERFTKDLLAERELYRTQQESINDQIRKLKEFELEQERMARKDYFESRSYTRKDTSEIVRWLPTIITGILGIVGIVFIKTKMAI